ncbi:MAG: hypothetical protein KJO50_09435, partial [Bacteroidia bacterium]|nr:hypothetical protein [Bacteroidia bacterium]
MKTLILALTLLCIGNFSSDAQSNYILGNKFVPEKPIQELDEIISHYTLFTADINKNNFKIDGTNNEIILDLGTQKYNFNLYNNNLVLRYESVANPLLLGGSMNFGGIVSLTINHNFIYGYIRYGETMLFIEPVRHFDKSAPDNLFVIYNAEYVIQSEEHICGVTKSEEKTNEFRLKMPTTMCNIVDFALANTYDMVTALGTVTDVENHNLAVLNNVQTNFRSEFDTNLEFELVDHFVPASAGADPFSATTSATALLSEFSAWGAGGNNSGGASGGFGVDYHRASLWTDRDIASGGNSGVVGLAQTPGGHNVLENYSASGGNLMSLQSHEIGHNFDAVSSSGTFHDPPSSATIMAPSVVITPDWSTASQSDISAHIATMTYL